MANGWAQAVLGAVSSPQTVAHPIDTGSLMNLGQMLAQKKQQNRYFDMQMQEYEQPRRQAALERLQAALTNPDDKMELQAAIADAKQWGVEVSGMDALLAGTPRETETAQAAADTGAEPTPKAEPAPTGKSNAPAWLDEFMAGQGAETPRGEAARVGTEADIAASEEHEVPRAVARATLIEGRSPQPLKGRPGRELTMPGQLPSPRRGNEVVVSVKGQPYARYNMEDMQNYRANQSAMVAHVFQPLVDQSADDTEKRAAEIAQKQAVEAYNSGMSKKDAIEYGTNAWKQMIGLRYKRDWNKFPPGFKFAMPGGGGGGHIMGDKQALATWDKLQDNERGWVSEARQQFKTNGAQQAVADAGLIEAATHAETPLAQNQGLMRILKEMSGTAVTDPEARRFYEGIGIMGQAELLLRRLEGGDISEDIRAGVQEIAGLIKARANESLAKAGDFVYQRMAGDTVFPGSDELRLNRARELRSLFTGERTTPMKVGKKGKLQTVDTSSDDEAEAASILGK